MKHVKLESKIKHVKIGLLAEYHQELTSRKLEQLRQNQKAEQSSQVQHEKAPEEINKTTQQPLAYEASREKYVLSVREVIDQALDSYLNLDAKEKLGALLKNNPSNEYATKEETSQVDIAKEDIRKNDHYSLEAITKQQRGEAIPAQKAITPPLPDKTAQQNGDNQEEIKEQAAEITSQIGKRDGKSVVDQMVPLLRQYLTGDECKEQSGLKGKKKGAENVPLKTAKGYEDDERILPALKKAQGDNEQGNQEGNKGRGVGKGHNKGDDHPGNAKGLEKKETGKLQTGDVKLPTQKETQDAYTRETALPRNLPDRELEGTTGTQNSREISEKGSQQAVKAAELEKESQEAIRTAEMLNKEKRVYEEIKTAKQIKLEEGAGIKEGINTGNSLNKEDEKTVREALKNIEQDGKDEPMKERTLQDRSNLQTLQNTLQQQESARARQAKIDDLHEMVKTETERIQNEVQIKADEIQKKAEIRAEQAARGEKVDTQSLKSEIHSEMQHLDGIFRSKMEQLQTDVQLRIDDIETDFLVRAEAISSEPTKIVGKNDSNIGNMEFPEKGKGKGKANENNQGQQGQDGNKIPPGLAKKMGSGNVQIEEQTTNTLQSNVEDNLVKVQSEMEKINAEVQSKLEKTKSDIETSVERTRSDVKSKVDSTNETDQSRTAQLKKARETTNDQIQNLKSAEAQAKKGESAESSEIKKELASEEQVLLQLEKSGKTGEKMDKTLFQSRQEGVRGTEELRADSRKHARDTGSKIGTPRDETIQTIQRELKARPVLSEAYPTAERSRTESVKPAETGPTLEPGPFSEKAKKGGEESSRFNLIKDSQMGLSQMSSWLTSKNQLLQPRPEMIKPPSAEATFVPPPVDFSKSAAIQGKEFYLPPGEGRVSPFTVDPIKTQVAKTGEISIPLVSDGAAKTIQPERKVLPPTVTPVHDGAASRIEKIVPRVTPLIPEPPQKIQDSQQVVQVKSQGEIRDKSIPPQQISSQSRAPQKVIVEPVAQEFAKVEPPRAPKVKIQEPVVQTKTEIKIEGPQVNESKSVTGKVSRSEEILASKTAVIGEKGIPPQQISSQSRAPQKVIVEPVAQEFAKIETQRVPQLRITPEIKPQIKSEPKTERIQFSEPKSITAKAPQDIPIKQVADAGEKASVVSSQKITKEISQVKSTPETTQAPKITGDINVKFEGPQTEGQNQRYLKDRTTESNIITDRGRTSQEKNTPKISSYDEKAGIASLTPREKPQQKPFLQDKSFTERKKEQQGIKDGSISYIGGKSSEAIKAVRETEMLTSAFGAMMSTELPGELQKRKTVVHERGYGQRFEKNDGPRIVEEIPDRERRFNDEESRDPGGPNKEQGDQKDKSGTSRITQNYIHTDQKQEIEQAQKAVEKQQVAERTQKENIRFAETQKQTPVKQASQAAQHAAMSIESLIKKSQSEIWTGDEMAAKIIYLLMKASSPFTFEHSSRVIDLSLELAKELGINNERQLREIEEGAMFHDIGEVEISLSNASQEELALLSGYLGTVNLKDCSFLHDIGKVKIPESIIYKPGPLTQMEYRILKRHPIIGEEILKPFPSMQHILPIVRHHHECWDGTGYPDQISGEEIPLAARIVSITDAYDAMVSDRPYRKGMPEYRAIKELKNGAGTQFDPVLVESFLRIIRRKKRSLRMLDSE